MPSAGPPPARRGLPLILRAFLGVGAPASGTTTQPPTVETAPTGPPGPHHLDGASVEALLDLLEDRRPTRRGLFAGLVKGLRGIWDAGTRAGQNVGRPRCAPVEGLTREACEKLTQMGEAEQAAAAAFCAVFDKNSTPAAS